MTFTPQAPAAACAALCAILLALTLSGCAVLENSNLTVQTPLTRAQVAAANAAPRKIFRIFQSNGAMLDSLPVGAIVPFYAAAGLALPENWKFCNGDTIRDEDSPLNGTALPDLIDDRFLMGSVGGYAGAGGSNVIPVDGMHQHQGTISQAGAHNHGGQTGPINQNGTLKEAEQAGEVQIRIVEQSHRHAITQAGQHTHAFQLTNAGGHNHGGDKKPQWYGVLYIMKIK